jgi:hypothetical protein
LAWSSGAVSQMRDRTSIGYEKDGAALLAMIARAYAQTLYPGRRNNNPTPRVRFAQIPAVRPRWIEFVKPTRSAHSPGVTGWAGFAPFFVIA